MRKVLFLFLLIIPIFSFSQGKTNNKEINWMSLEKAEEYASKYNQNILIFFYKPECDFCEKMKKETLSDPEIINLINTKFYPVKINGYTKDIIEFNGVIYKNEQPAEKGHFWRHDFYFEFGRYKDGIITPTISIVNGKHEKVTQFTGFQPKAQLIRSIKQILK
jgi:thioredoxin-related protein